MDETRKTTWSRRADATVALIGLCLLAVCIPVLRPSEVGWLIAAGLAGAAVRWADHRRKRRLAQALAGLALGSMVVAAAIGPGWYGVAVFVLLHLVPLALAVTTGRLAFVVCLAPLGLRGDLPALCILTFAITRLALCPRAGGDAVRDRLSCAAAGLFASFVAAGLAHDLVASMKAFVLAGQHVHVDGLPTLLPRVLLELACVVAAFGLARGRGWGLVGLTLGGPALALVLGIGTALDIQLPVFGAGCLGFSHALEWYSGNLVVVAAWALAVGPWVRPAARFLRGGQSRR